MATGLRKNSIGSPRAGPLFVAPPMWNGGESPGPPLTDEERAHLAVTATVVRFNRRETIFDEGDPAAAIFSIIAGVIKLYRVQPDRKEHIVRFTLQNDLIGLAEYRQYVNSAKSITNTILFKIPTRALEMRLRQSPGLEFHIITKLCHDLRRTQDHALLLANRRADTKIALFIATLEKQQDPTASNSAELYLPMSRADIASYVGISPEAVSRSFVDLVGLGAIAFRNRHHLKIADRAKLEAVIAGTDRPGRPVTAPAQHG